MAGNSSDTQQAERPNPALEELAALIGKWDMDLSNASFLSDPSGVLRGFAEFEWIENGAFLVLRQGAKNGPPSAHWVIGADDTNKTYRVLYFDDRSVSRIYQMSYAAACGRCGANRRASTSALRVRSARTAGSFRAGGKNQPTEQCGSTILI